MIANLGSVWLQKLKCVIAKTAGLFLWLQKEKKNWTSVWLQLVGVRDCNQELCVVAKKPDFVCVVEKNKITNEAKN
jgi:hypothetical protein